MAVTDSDPTDGPFDYRTNNDDGTSPTTNDLNVARKLGDRDEIRRVTWLTYTGAVKVKTSDIEATLDAVDMSDLTVEVTNGGRPSEWALVIEV